MCSHNPLKSRVLVPNRTTPIPYSVSLVVFYKWNSAYVATAQMTSMPHQKPIRILIDVAYAPGTVLHTEYSSSLSVRWAVDICLPGPLRSTSVGMCDFTTTPFGFNAVFHHFERTCRAEFCISSTANLLQPFNETFPSLGNTWEHPLPLVAFVLDELLQLLSIFQWLSFLPSLWSSLWFLTVANHELSTSSAREPGRPESCVPPEREREAWRASTFCPATSSVFPACSGWRPHFVSKLKMKNNKRIMSIQNASALHAQTHSELT